MKIPCAASLHTWLIVLGLPALAVGASLAGSRLAGIPATPQDYLPEGVRPQVSRHLPAGGDVPEVSLEVVEGGEGGKAVYRLQVVPGGDEMIVDPVTGKLLAVRPGWEKPAPRAASE
jgi:hypothetical protein